MHSDIYKDPSFANPFFIGTVEDNNDPTNNYRVKVRIDKMHPNTITTAQLPWAAKVDASFMGMDSSSILHGIPEIGSKVLVLAIGNDINSLVYLGCLYKNTSSTPSGDNYINNYGIYNKNGEFIGVEKIRGIFHMIWNGDLTLDIQGKVKIGSNATEPAALGTKLETLLMTIISTFNTHTHTGNLGMPTSSPSSQITYKDVTSQKITLE